MEERREERVEEDNIEDMTRDFGVEAFCQARVYEIMSVNAETPCISVQLSSRGCYRF